MMQEDAFFLSLFFMDFDAIFRQTVEKYRRTNFVDKS